jgi:hypothetical protein
LAASEKAYQPDSFSIASSSGLRLSYLKPAIRSGSAKALVSIPIGIAGSR